MRSNQRDKLSTDLAEPSALGSPSVDFSTLACLGPRWKRSMIATDLGAANFSEILELKVVFSSPLVSMLWRMLGPNESLWDDAHRSMHRIRGLVTCNHLPCSLSATVSEDGPLAHI